MIQTESLAAAESLIFQAYKLLAKQVLDHPADCDCLTCQAAGHAADGAHCINAVLDAEREERKANS